MNFRHIFTVYLKELRDTLRDRRTVITTIVIPTVAIPLIMFGVGTVMSKVLQKAREESTTLVVLGGADSPELTAALRADKKFRIVETKDDFKQLISEKKVRVAIGIPPGFDQSLKAGEQKKITIYHYKDELNSNIGTGALHEFLNDYSRRVLAGRLQENHLPETWLKPFDVEEENVATAEKVGGNNFGGIIPYVIILLCFTGAMYPAMDLTAGEKERGTMETLLCSPVDRLNIVLGKFLMVLTASLTTMLLSLVSLAVNAAIGVTVFGGTGGGRMAAAAAITKSVAGAAGAHNGNDVIPLVDPLGIVGVFGMVFPIAIFFAALLLSLSLFAKSYKEAQSYVSPLVMVVVLPAVLGMLPGIELTARTALVPILSLSLVCKEMLSGVWHWNYIALIFGSSCVYAAVALAFAVRLFNREGVMFRA